MSGPGGRRPWVLGGFAALGYAFLFAPVVWLALVSVNSDRSVTRLGGISLRWYAALAADQRVRAALWLTVRLGLTTAVVCAVLGTLAAFGLRDAGPGRRLWLALLGLPLVVPEIVLGVSLLALIGRVGGVVGLHLGFGGLLVAHVAFSLSVVVVVVRARLAALDASGEGALLEAAADLGAPPRTVFTTVTVPLIAPAVAAGAASAFLLSFDDVITSSYLTAAGSTTLPVYVYSQASKRGVSPEVVALSTTLVAVSTVTLLIGAGLAGWWSRRAAAGRS